MPTSILEWKSFSMLAVDHAHLGSSISKLQSFRMAIAACCSQRFGAESQREVSEYISRCKTWREVSYEGTKDGWSRWGGVGLNENGGRKARDRASFSFSARVPCWLSDECRDLALIARCSEAASTSGTTSGTLNSSPSSEDSRRVRHRTRGRLYGTCTDSGSN